MSTLLICWGLIEVVTALSYQSVFRVHESAPTVSESHVAHAFESLLISLNIDTSDSEKVSAGNSGGGIGSGGSGVKKSTSYSSVPAAPVRVRADSDGNIKSVSSQGSVDVPSTSLLRKAPSNVVGPVNPSQVVISVRKDPQPTTVSLDSIGVIPSRYGLSSILALFDGARNLKDLIWLMERPLQKHIGAIVVFLLRFFLIFNCLYCDNSLV